MKSRGKDSTDSWIVAAACCMIFLLTSLPLTLGGLLYVNILEHYETTRKEAFLPFSLAHIMRCISGPFAGYFSAKFGLQGVTFIGCFISAVATGSCFFAENINTVIISLGVIYGCAFGWATALAPEFINLHFDKHRAKGNGIVFGGITFGGFIVSPAVQLLLRTFGLSGTFLIMSAISLNSIPAVMLLTKPRPERKQKNRQSTLELADCEITTRCQKVSNPHPVLELTNDFTRYHNVSNPRPVLEPTNDFGDNLYFERSEHPCRNSIDKNSTSSNKIKILDNKDSSVSTQFSTCNELNSSHRNGEKPDSNFYEMKLEGKNAQQFNSPDFKIKPVAESPEENKAKSKLTAKFLTNCPSLKAFNVIWSPTFLLLTFTQSSFVYIHYVIYTIIVDVARDKGIEKYLEVYFIMALSISDSIGRFTLGHVTDSGLMTNANFCALCFAIAGLCSVALVWLNTFITTLVCVSSLALMGGGSIAVQPSIITDYISKENRAVAMASRLLMYVPMGFTMSPLIGYFRSELGSYDGLLYTLSSQSIICSILLLILPSMSK